MTAEQLLHIIQHGEGINVELKTSKEKLNKDTNANNPQKLNPTYYFSPEIIELTTQKIMEILLKNPTITREKMMLELGGISENGVKYHLNKLKKEEKIIRVGSDRNGFWKVIL
jgi:predicted HTH transcriptional regulator